MRWTQIEFWVKWKTCCFQIHRGKEGLNIKWDSQMGDWESEFTRYEEGRDQEPLIVEQWQELKSWIIEKCETVPCE